MSSERRVRVRIPESHPRYRSLMERETLVEGFLTGMVVPEGLIAHGRGEAFDYLIGETTIEPARRAIEAAAAALLVSAKPVVSVNGNAASLVGRELVELSNEFGLPLEVNLFYRTEERLRRINVYLRELGAKHLVECESPIELPAPESERRRVCEEGIGGADLVLVMIEDGDRTQALRSMGKIVVAVDLNPLSRTSLAANITIVDNVTRAVPLLRSELRRAKGLPREVLRRRLETYDNARVLAEVLAHIKRRLEELSSSLISRSSVAPASTR
ncbi:MAG: phosphopantothenate/pantothenate synthetase [Fervidicoccaceae archaeon]